MENIINPSEGKREGTARTGKELPIYQDIKRKYDEADVKTKELLMELIIRRALSDDKMLKKRLGQTYDNRKNEDGSVTHLIGFYSKDDMDEREADDMIVARHHDISRMWVIDKYSDLANMLK